MSCSFNHQLIHVSVVFFQSIHVHIQNAADIELLCWKRISSRAWCPQRHFLDKWVIVIQVKLIIVSGLTHGWLRQKPYCNQSRDNSYLLHAASAACLLADGKWVSIDKTFANMDERFGVPVHGASRQRSQHGFQLQIDFQSTIETKFAIFQKKKKRMNMFLASSTYQKLPANCKLHKT